VGTPRWKRFLQTPRIANLGRRFVRHIALVQVRWSPPGYLGLQLTTGTLVLIGTSWLFGWIAENVVTGASLTLVDIHVTDWFHAHVNRGLTQLMLLITHLHGTIAMSVYSLAMAAYLMWKKAWYWLGAFALAVPGGMLLNVLLKFAYHRARPSFSDPILTLSSYSFPSGHVTSATLFYGILAAFLVSRIRSWRWRAAILLSAILLVALVGLTRIYLGAHYFSDVLGGAAGSAAWLALCLTAMNTLRQKEEGAKLIEPGRKP
jgi:membrane-associated phospholipid phosphatase